MLEAILARVTFDVAATHLGDRAGDPLSVDDGVARDANRVELLRREEGIIAIDRRSVEQVAGRSDLRMRPVIHEHRFEVGLCAFANLVFGKPAESVALVGALVEVVGTGIERR